MLRLQANLSGLAVLFLASTSACVEKNSDPSLLNAQLNLASYTLISGKPGAPGEKLMLERIDDKCFFTAQRFQNDDQVLNKEQKVIACDLLTDLWKKVLEVDLLNYKAEEVSESSFDFGERRLSLSWIDKDNAENNYNIAWFNELKNNSRVAVVIDELTEIYREQDISFKLHYIKKM